MRPDAMRRYYVWGDHDEPDNPWHANLKDALRYKPPRDELPLNKVYVRGYTVIAVVQEGSEARHA